MVSTVHAVRHPISYASAKTDTSRRLPPAALVPAHLPRHYVHHDPQDLLDPAWQSPLPPLHPRLARARKRLNAAIMHPLLATGRWGLRAALHVVGFDRYRVQTRLGRLNVFDALGRGDLPPIVLVLGIGGTSTDYLIMLKRLLPHFQRIMILDLPGHGFSEEPQGPVSDASIAGSVRDALDQLIAPLGSAIVLGHSLGGKLAVRYALDRPHRVRGLVLAGPIGAPFSPRQLEVYYDLYRGIETRDQASLIIHNAFWGEPGKRLLIAAAWARLSSKVAQAMINSDLITGPLPPQALRALRPPVMLIWGRDDHLLPTSHLHYFMQHLPLGRIVVRPPHVNHNNPAMGPFEVINPVVAFARCISRGRLGTPRPATRPA